MAPKSKATTPIGSCIIVGGGIGGIQVARQLVKAAGNIKVTIVDRQDYVDWCIASPRSVVSPDDVKKYGYTMPMKNVCEFLGSDITFVHSAVAKIGPTSVTLEDDGSGDGLGEVHTDYDTAAAASTTVLTADCVVVAIGGQYASGAIWKATPDQTTMELRVAAFRALHDKISKAKAIVVAGAGPSGVEVAGEIKAAFPATKVTLVGTMLPNSPEALQKRMRKALEKLGVVVMKGRVDTDAVPDSKGKVTLRSGEAVEGDLILNAAGFCFAGAKLADETLAADVTTRGQFTCRPTLQLANCDTVFACGDILAVPEGCYADVKGVQHATDTGAVVAENVVRLLKGGTALKPFAWSKVPIDKPMMTALGPKVAVGYMGMPKFLENFMGRQLKCKDFYMSIQGSTYGKGKTW